MEMNSIIRENPETGNLLVSQPYLGDPNFEQSVILLTEHGEGGTVGFVLNHKVEITLNDIVLNFPDFESDVYNGGPVRQDNLYFIHSKGDLLPGSQKINDNLWWGGDVEPLKELIGAGLIQTNEIRFFLGYSGWSEGQLFDELRDNSWLIVDGSKFDLLHESPQHLWKNILLKSGGEYPLWASSPADPNLN